MILHVGAPLRQFLLQRLLHTGINTPSCAQCCPVTRHKNWDICHLEESCKLLCKFGSVMVNKNF